VNIVSLIIEAVSTAIDGNIAGVAVKQTSLGKLADSFRQIVTKVAARPRQSIFGRSSH